jgi:hypothetical protein
VAAVALHDTTGVAVGEALLDGIELGVGLAGAWYFAYHLDPAPQFDAAQFTVAVAGVDDDGDARVALHVGPPLASGDRGQPDEAGVPREPERSHVRASGADGCDSARALLGEERIELAVGHSNGASAALWFHGSPLRVG